MGKLPTLSLSCFFCFIYLFIFLFCCKACGTLVPQSGIKPVPFALEAPSLNQGSPCLSSLCIEFKLLLIKKWVSVTLGCWKFQLKKHLRNHVAVHVPENKGHQVSTVISGLDVIFKELLDPKLFLNVSVIMASFLWLKVHQIRFLGSSLKEFFSLNYF